MFRTSTLCALLALVAPSIADAADPTIGWLGSTPATFEGYTILAPMTSTTTYLLDGAGRVVHTWPSVHRPGLTVYLQDNGDLLRSGRVLGPNPPISSGGVGGVVELIAWDGTLLWRYTYSSPTVQQHHDIERLPNGNVLILAWELKTGAEAIAAGRDPALISQGELWPEHLVEVSQTGPTTGAIVWEWHLWDHLVQDFDAAQANFGVVADHPELIDLNAAPNGSADWIHSNSIDYHATLDQIVISANRLDEIWIIDHSTTPAESASHSGGNAGRGGDLLYRWGNPVTYGAGTVADEMLWGQHCVEWIPGGFPGAGNITIFNNGAGRPGGNYSSVDEITPPLEPGGTYTWPTQGSPFGPSTLTWTYSAPNPFDFYAAFISGTRRLPNGNTVIIDGPTGHLFEVDTVGDVVWEYIVPISGVTPLLQGSPPPNSQTFRPTRIAPDHPGLVGQALTPGTPIEIYPSLGDFDVDGDIDLDDHSCFVDLFTGPGNGVDVEFANASGFFGDFDDDGDLDCDDAMALEAAWTSGAAFPQLPACALSTEFRRGDANLDGGVDIADAVAGLAYLFLSASLGCHSAADVNDDGGLDIADPIALLDALFGSGGPIPDPAACGVDPTADGLGCASTACP